MMGFFSKKPSLVDKKQKKEQSKRKNKSKSSCTKPGLIGSVITSSAGTSSLTGSSRENDFQDQSKAEVSNQNLSVPSSNEDETITSLIYNGGVNAQTVDHKNVREVFKKCLKHSQEKQKCVHFGKVDKQKMPKQRFALTNPNCENKKNHKYYQTQKDWSSGFQASPVTNLVASSPQAVRIPFLQSQQLKSPGKSSLFVPSAQTITTSITDAHKGQQNDIKDINEKEMRMSVPSDYPRSMRTKMITSSERSAKQKKPKAIQPKGDIVIEMDSGGHGKRSSSRSTTIMASQFQQKQKKNEWMSGMLFTQKFLLMISLISVASFIILSIHSIQQHPFFSKISHGGINVTDTTSVQNYLALERKDQGAISLFYKGILMGLPSQNPVDVFLHITLQQKKSSKETHSHGS